jgi:spore maturation protein CgeB
VADGYSVNYRLFEGTGMGALVVTESSKNITDLFEPGREILTYDSISNAVTIIKKALSDFDNYSKIAEAGQKRTLTSHTFKNRSQELEAYLVRILEGKRKAGGS